MTGEFFSAEIDFYVAGFGVEGAEGQVDGLLARGETFFGCGGEELAWGWGRWGGRVRWELRLSGVEVLLFLEVELVADVEDSGDDGGAD